MNNMKNKILLFARNVISIFVIVLCRYTDCQNSGVIKRNHGNKETHRHERILRLSNHTVENYRHKREPSPQMFLRGDGYQPLIHESYDRPLMGMPYHGRGRIHQQHYYGDAGFPGSPSRRLSVDPRPADLERRPFEGQGILANAEVPRVSHNADRSFGGALLPRPSEPVIGSRHLFPAGETRPDFVDHNAAFAAAPNFNEVSMPFGSLGDETSEPQFPMHYHHNVHMHMPHALENLGYNEPENAENFMNNDAVGYDDSANRHEKKTWVTDVNVYSKKKNLDDLAALLNGDDNDAEDDYVIGRGRIHQQHYYGDAGFPGSPSRRLSVDPRPADLERRPFEGQGILANAEVPRVSHNADRSFGGALLPRPSEPVIGSRHLFPAGETRPDFVDHNAAFAAAPNFNEVSMPFGSLGDETSEPQFPMHYHHNVHMHMPHALENLGYNEPENAENFMNNDAVGYDDSANRHEKKTWVTDVNVYSKKKNLDDLAALLNGDDNDAEDDYDPCASKPCHNGGVCKTKGLTAFECICPRRYKGQYCQDKSRCHPNPCDNEGKCTELAHGFECTCQVGYKGVRCRERNQCLPNPCLNDGLCNESPQGFVCTCQEGYQGKTCEERRTVCTPNPCLNGGKCAADIFGKYQCICESGYSGKMCEEFSLAKSLQAEQSKLGLPVQKSVVESPDGSVSTSLALSAINCLNNPCMNAGICRPDPSSTNGFQCECPAQYRGSICEEKKCKCENGGVCVGEGVETKCICKAGYAGALCTEHTQCNEDTCMHGGICIEQVGGFKCKCDEGYKGSRCEISDRCNPNPCLHGGKCKDYGDFYKCECSPTYVGKQCEDLNFCFPNPCKNNGKCLGYLGGFQCDCADGFTGKSCEQQLFCRSNPCRNGARCEDSEEGFKCTCTGPYQGKLCEVNNYCFGQPCLNGGSCSNGRDGFICTCQERFKGRYCNVMDRCFEKPCKNGGRCVSSSTGEYRCDCLLGFSGKTCEATDPCQPNPCRQGGICLPGQNGGFTCQCKEGYRGLTCADVDPCHPNPCSHGTCAEVNGGYVCNCTTGFRGATCSDIDRCSPNPCFHNGHCKEIIGGVGYVCECPLGYKGQMCDLKDPCHPSPCKHDGICQEVAGSDTGFICKCSHGFRGSHCQAIDPCFPNPCNHNGQCIIADENSHKCNCSAGYKGAKCDDIDLCSPNPCRFGTHCIQTDEESYQCVKNLCIPSPCMFSGKCIVVNDETYECACPKGRKGKNCEAQDNCYPNPCENGGTCSEAASGGFECQCPSGYTGKSCTEMTRRAIVDFCASSPCKNGGTCVNTEGGFTCRCQVGYSGPVCEDSVCMPNPCENAGTCVPYYGIALCKCREQFTGAHCSEFKIRPTGVGRYAPAPTTKQPNVYYNFVPKAPVVESKPEKKSGNYTVFVVGNPISKTDALMQTQLGPQLSLQQRLQGLSFDDEVKSNNMIIGPSVNRVIQKFLETENKVSDPKERQSSSNSITLIDNTQPYLSTTTGLSATPLSDPRQELREGVRQDLVSLQGSPQELTGKQSKSVQPETTQFPVSGTIQGPPQQSINAQALKPKSGTGNPSQQSLSAGLTAPASSLGSGQQVSQSRINTQPVSQFQPSSGSPSQQAPFPGQRMQAFSPSDGSISQLVSRVSTKTAEMSQKTSQGTANSPQLQLSIQTQVPSSIPQQSYHPSIAVAHNQPPVELSTGKQTSSGSQTLPLKSSSPPDWHQVPTQEQSEQVPSTNQYRVTNKVSDLPKTEPHLLQNTVLMPNEQTSTQHQSDVYLPRKSPPPQQHKIAEVQPLLLGKTTFEQKVKKENPCASNPCKNGGTCVVRTDKTTECVCLENYSGPRCEDIGKYGYSSAPKFFPKDECKHCDRNAKCINSHCICKPGFVGDGLECWVQSRKDIDWSCATNPCLNGGTCKPGRGRCVCRLGFTGDFCENYCPPIVHLSFDKLQGSIVKDESNNDNDATLANGASIVPEGGKCDSAVSLSGGDILFDGQQFWPKPVAAVTMALWIKLDTNKGIQSIFDTVGGEYSTHREGQYHLEIEDGKVRWFHRNEKHTTVFSVITEELVREGNWNHIVGTYESKSGEAKVYLNGDLVGQETGSGYLSQDWLTKAGIGKHEHQFGNRLLRGMVDEFYIFACALPRLEILVLMNHCKLYFGGQKKKAAVQGASRSASVGNRLKAPMAKEAKITSIITQIEPIKVKPNAQFSHLLMPQPPVSRYESARERGEIPPSQFNQKYQQTFIQDDNGSTGVTSPEMALAKFLNATSRSSKPLQDFGMKTISSKFVHRPDGHRIVQQKPLGPHLNQVNMPGFMNKLLEWMYTPTTQTAQTSRVTKTPSAPIQKRPFSRNNINSIRFKENAALATRMAKLRMQQAKLHQRGTPMKLKPVLDQLANANRRTKQIKVPFIRRQPATMTASKRLFSTSFKNAMRIKAQAARQAMVKANIQRNSNKYLANKLLSKLPSQLRTPVSYLKKFLPISLNYAKPQQIHDIRQKGKAMDLASRHSMVPSNNPISRILLGESIPDMAPILLPKSKPAHAIVTMPSRITGPPHLVRAAKMAAIRNPVWKAKWEYYVKQQRAKQLESQIRNRKLSLYKASSINDPAEVDPSAEQARWQGIASAIAQRKLQTPKTYIGVPPYHNARLIQQPIAQYRRVNVAPRVVASTAYQRNNMETWKMNSKSGAHGLSTTSSDPQDNGGNGYSYGYGYGYGNGNPIDGFGYGHGTGGGGPVNRNGKPGNGFKTGSGQGYGQGGPTGNQGQQLITNQQNRQPYYSSHRNDLYSTTDNHISRSMLTPIGNLPQKALQPQNQDAFFIPTKPKGPSIMNFIDPATKRSMLDPQYNSRLGISARQNYYVQQQNKDSLGQYYSRYTDRLLKRQTKDEDEKRKKPDKHRTKSKKKKRKKRRT